MSRGSTSAAATHQRSGASLLSLGQMLTAIWAVSPEELFRNNKITNSNSACGEGAQEVEHVLFNCKNKDIIRLY